MKTVKKITFSAVMACAATVIMLIAYFPYFTYAVPAVAGLCIMITVMEIDCKWAFLTYITSAFLSLIFAEIESKLIFVFFFGFYPIIKSVIERLSKLILEWILKILTFNICVIFVYGVFENLLFTSTENAEMFANYGKLILLLIGNVVFVVYDIALSRLSTVYFKKFHKTIKRFLK